MKKKIFIIIGSIIACGALAYLLFALFSNRAPYDMTVSQFIDKENSYIGKQIRVDGYVMQDTIDWTSTLHYNLKFILDNDSTDNGKTLIVSYQGEKQDPSKFIGGIRILVAGKYDKKDGVFIANSITYECPNEYKGS
jgi:cytochrome c-type biogenesis protein CcmE